MSSQNALLHQHLESVSSQAAKIRQTATDSGASPAAEGETSEDADTKLAELRSLVTYLRREKEIVDLQLDVTKQENTRLKNRVEDLSQSLQEARTTLSEVGLWPLSSDLNLTCIEIGARTCRPKRSLSFPTCRACGTDQPAQHPPRKQCHASSRI